MEDFRREFGIEGSISMCVGNLQPYPGIDLLLRSFALVRQACGDAHLIVIGGTAPEATDREKLIRPAMTWGPGDQRTIKLFRLIQKRRLPVIGFRRTELHWVMVDDVARVFRLAAETEGIDGEVFIIAGREAVPMARLFDLIAHAVGVDRLKLRIPALPIQLLGTIVEAVAVPLGVEPPIYRRRVDFFTKTRSFDGSKARRVLGYEPDRSIEEEIAEIVASYRATGALD